MKIVHICPSATRRAGGLFNSVRGLANALANLNYKISVLSGADSQYEGDHSLWSASSNLRLFPKFKPYKFSYMPDLYRGIVECNPDIVHIHGIWSYHAIAALRWKKDNPNKKLVISPRGMLDKNALLISPKIKSFARLLYVDELLSRCDYFHALNDSEFSSISNIASERANIFVSPNGVHLPSELGDSIDINESCINFIFIGRLHPKKGLENLLLSVKYVATFSKNFRLKIAGWGDSNYIIHLKNIVDSLGISDYVSFEGPKYNIEKDSFLRGAHCFILPSFSEGLPVSVLEAWSYGIFTLITPECNFGDLSVSEFSNLISHDPVNISIQMISFIERHSAEKTIIRFHSATDLIRKSYGWDVIAPVVGYNYKKMLDNSIGSN